LLGGGLPSVWLLGKVVVVPQGHPGRKGTNFGRGGAGGKQEKGRLTPKLVPGLERTRKVFRSRKVLSPSQRKARTESGDKKPGTGENWNVFRRGGGGDRCSLRNQLSTVKRSQQEKDNFHARDKFRCPPVREGWGKKPMCTGGSRLKCTLKRQGGRKRKRTRKIESKSPTPSKGPPRWGVLLKIEKELKKPQKKNKRKETPV